MAENIITDSLSYFHAGKLKIGKYSNIHEVKNIEIIMLIWSANLLFKSDVKDQVKENTIISLHI